MIKLRGILARDFQRVNESVMALYRTTYYETASVVRGYHVYKSIWTPVIGEELLCEREEGNPSDRYAVSVLDLSTVVGHVPRHISTLCNVFIRRGGSISCIITGMHQYSRDLPQGGMEVPCKYRFTGNPKELGKVERCLQGGDERQRPIPSDDSKVPILAPAMTLSPPHEKKSLGAAKLIYGVLSSSTNDKSSGLQAKPLPEKVVLEKVLDDNDDDSEVETGNWPTDPTWVTYDRHVLRMSDKIIIESGELSDKHISMGQYCIKKQFPLIGGLNSTLLQEKIVIGCTANTIQVIHCQKRRHWITVSTKWCKAGQLNVYDTAFDKLDSQSRRLVKTMFSLKSADSICMVPVQKQQGGSDCGAFALATMTSIAFNENPSEINYRQDKLREHLLECFVGQKMTPFPRSEV